MDKWKPKCINGEYYAHRFFKNDGGRRQEEIFTDFNGEKLALGKDEKWANKWCEMRNEIQGL